MANTTIPAWVSHAAVAIINSVDANPAYHSEVKDSTAAHMARIISENAPDAEALARALEECVRCINYHGITGDPASFMADSVLAAQAGKETK